MVITPVDQRYFDIGSFQRTRRRNSGKSAANDHNALLPGNLIRWCRLFRREGFGQNCAQCCTR
jgi:hypothetical protein